jgi:hypothetical protein
MKVDTKTIVLIAAVLFVLLTGLRFLPSFHKPAPPPQATNPFGSFAPPASGMPDMSKIAGDQATVFKLMTQYGLGVGTATYLAQAKIQVLSQSNTSVHFALTLPKGVTSDGTITITPDVKYTPTPAELEQAAKSGAHTYNVKFTVENQSDTKAHMTLQYFVPYSAVPAELQQKIHGQSSSVRRLQLVPLVWAQEGGGEGSGMSVSQETGLEVAKEVLTEQAEEGKLSKEFPKPLEGLMDVLKAFKKEQEHIAWLDELDELQDCAENPTNPLTRKAFDQDPAYRDQVVHGVTQSRGDVTGFTGMRFLNLGVSVAIGEQSGPLGVMIGPVGSWTDETLKQLAERRITDAQKNVTPCDVPMTPGDLRPMEGTLKYIYILKPLDGKSSETRMAEGKFELNVVQGGLAGEGTAKFTYDSMSMSDNPICKGVGATAKAKGDVEIKAAGGGTPFGGVIELHFDGDLPVAGTQLVGNGANNCIEQSRSETDHFGSVCHFDHIDMVNGGKYSTFAQDDPHGTCTIEISRK